MSEYIATPAMIAAAWDAWSPRRGPHNKLGPGPAFSEAIAAAIRVMPKPEPAGRSVLSQDQGASDGQ